MTEFYIYFENGMPKGTAQQKGERVIMKKGKPVILHYKKESVTSARSEFVYRLRRHKPATPSTKPIRLSLYFYFDVKDRKLWGKPKPTRPDCDGYAKEFIDAMQGLFFMDDSQVYDLRVVKYYAEHAAAVVRWEEVEP